MTEELDPIVHPQRPSLITREERERVDKINVMLKMYGIEGHVEYIEPKGAAYRKGKPFAIFYKTLQISGGLTRRSFRRVKDLERFSQVLFKRIQESDTGEL